MLVVMTMNVYLMTPVFLGYFVGYILQPLIHHGVQHQTDSKTDNLPRSADTPTSHRRAENSNGYIPTGELEKRGLLVVEYMTTV